MLNFLFVPTQNMKMEKMKMSKKLDHCRHWLSLQQVNAIKTRCLMGALIHHLGEGSYTETLCYSEKTTKFRFKTSGIFLLPITKFLKSKINTHIPAL